MNSGGGGAGGHVNSGGGGAGGHVNSGGGATNQPHKNTSCGRVSGGVITTRPAGGRPGFEQGRWEP